MRKNKSSVYNNVNYLCTGICSLYWNFLRTPCKPLYKPGAYKDSPRLPLHFLFPQNQNCSSRSSTQLSLHPWVIYIPAGLSVLYPEHDLTSVCEGSTVRSDSDSGGPQTNSLILPVSAGIVSACVCVCVCRYPLLLTTRNVSVCLLWGNWIIFTENCNRGMQSRRGGK